MSPMRILLLLLVLLCPPVWAQEASWRRWLSSCQVGSPVEVDDLAVFPLSGRSAELPRALSLDAALQQKAVSIREVSESGSVNQLKVENLGERPLFIMAGEVLTGARQDRVLKHDLWLAPDSGPVVVEAFCVEHGRWAYRGDRKHFESDGTISNAKVRAAALSPGGQGGVWQSVDETSARMGVASPTKALNAVYHDPRSKERIERITRRLADLVDEREEMRGVAVQVGNRIVAVDVFPDRRILRSLWPKLVKSYAVEAVQARSELDSLSRSRVESFLEAAQQAESRELDTPGRGRLVALGSSQLTGSALSLEDGLVHLQLLGKEKPTPTTRRYDWPPAIDLVKPKHR